MKIQSLFVLAVAAATVAANTAAAAAGRDLLSVAKSKPQFSTFAKAIEAAGLAETLASEGARFTVFMPTNDAFAKLPAADLDALLKPENKDKLADILKFHVVATKVRAPEDLPRKREFRSVQGADIKIELVNGSLRADGARVGRNFAASNGMIFAIDSVMSPN